MSIQTAPLDRTNDSGSWPPKHQAILAAFLLGVVFFYLQFPTLFHPYYWDSLYAADTATRILQNSFNPILKDFPDPGHPVLFQEIYALGWWILGHRVWWPHVVVLFFSFLALFFTYRLGTWVADPTVGLAAAFLLMMDPLFLAQSGQIYLAAPSFGLTTAALYYLATQQPRAFALTGSLAALSYLPAVSFLFVLIGFAWLTSWRRQKHFLLWYSIPAVVFLVWLVFHRLSYGYWVSHPAYWAGKQRSILLNSEGLMHIGMNLHDVLLRVWRIPFTALIVLAIVVGVVAWLLRRSNLQWAAKWLAYSSHPSRRRVFGLFLAATLIHLPLMSIGTSQELLGRYYLFLIPPFFVLAIDFLHSAFPRAVIVVVILLALNLHAHWYDPKEPWRYNFEETLLYRPALQAEMQAAQYLAREFPNSTIAAAWPHSRQLREPALHYVEKPLTVLGLGEISPETPIDLIYFSTHSLAQERDRWLDLIEERAARPIRAFDGGRTKITILKPGDNLAVPNYRSQFLRVEAPNLVQTDSEFTIQVTVKNLGRKVWRRDGDIRLSYFWVSNGQVIPDLGNVRTAMETDVFWGDAIQLTPRIRAPSNPGRYELRIDLVHELVTWFSEQGNEPPTTSIEVRP